MKGTASRSLVLVLAMWPTDAQAQTRRWVDEKGVVNYSNIPTGEEEPAANPFAALVVRREGASEPLVLAEAERAALETLLGIALGQELHCKGGLGRYCTSLEEMVEKFGSGERHPGQDPNYRYVVRPAGGSFEIAALPRRPGLARFFGDQGREAIHYNPKGPASRRDGKLILDQGGAPAAPR